MQIQNLLNLMKMIERFFSSKSNSSFIFTFGDTGVGKSTLLAAIAKLLSEEAVVRINPKNKKGSSLLLGKWVHQLKKGYFPPRTNKGEIIEVDISAEFVKGNGDSIQFTFLEMSGEDLARINIINGDGALGDKYNDYLRRSDVFIVVTDTKNASDDDLIIWQFFSHLANLNRDDLLVALVVTKWDLMNEDDSLENFVKSRMPQSFMWLSSGEFEEVRAFSFSIGTVDKAVNEVDSKITNYNSEDTKKITEWLYEIL